MKERPSQEPEFRPEFLRRNFRRNYRRLHQLVTAAKTVFAREAFLNARGIIPLSPEDKSRKIY